MLIPLGSFTGNEGMSPLWGHTGDLYFTKNHVTGVSMGSVFPYEEANKTLLTIGHLEGGGIILAADTGVSAVAGDIPISGQPYNLSSSVPKFTLKASETEAHIGTSDAIPLKITINDDVKGIIDDAGQFGWGTETPSTFFHVAGTTIVGGDQPTDKKIRLLPESLDISYIQVGESNSDINAHLHISRYSTTASNIKTFNVYADTSSFYGDVIIGGDTSFAGATFTKNGLIGGDQFVVSVNSDSTTGGGIDVNAIRPRLRLSDASASAWYYEWYVNQTQLKLSRGQTAFPHIVDADNIIVVNNENKVFVGTNNGRGMFSVHSQSAEETTLSQVRLSNSNGAASIHKFGVDTGRYEKGGIAWVRDGTNGIGHFEFLLDESTDSAHVGMSDSIASITPVGIGWKTDPDYMLDLHGDTYKGISLVRDLDSDGAGVYLSFGASTNKTRKAAIVFEREAGVTNGIGDLHFLVDSVDDANDVNFTSDKKMVLTHEGRLGVGTTDPEQDLQYASSIPVMRFEDIGGGIQDTWDVGVNYSPTGDRNGADTRWGDFGIWNITENTGMAIARTGEVSIGTQSTAHMLTVQGTKDTGYGAYVNNLGTGHGLYVRANTTDNADYIIRGLNGSFQDVFSVRADGVGYVRDSLGVGITPTVKFHTLGDVTHQVGVSEDFIVHDPNSGGVTYTIWYEQSTNSVKLGTGNGNVQVRTDLQVDDYTKLGSDAPAIKMKKLTGTTAATEGSSVSVAHGLVQSKILEVSVLVNDGTALRLPNDNTNAGTEYWVEVTNTEVTVANHNTRSDDILSKPFTVLITYEE